MKRKRPPRVPPQTEPVVIQAGMLP
jgi:hypothetical protein